MSRTKFFPEIFPENWLLNLADSKICTNFAVAKGFHVRVVRYRSAKPFTPVRVWLEPLKKRNDLRSLRFLYVRAAGSHHSGRNSPAGRYQHGPVSARAGISTGRYQHGPVSARAGISAGRYQRGAVSARRYQRVGISTGMYQRALVSAWGRYQRGAVLLSGEAGIHQKYSGAGPAGSTGSGQTSGSITGAYSGSCFSRLS